MSGSNPQFSTYLHPMVFHSFYKLCIIFFLSVSTIYSQSQPHRCGQDHQMQKWFMKMPELQDQIEKGFEEFNKTKGGSRQTGGIIAVHVIIVHPAGQAIGQGQNFSLEHVQSQIDVLNEDFGRYNGDAGNTPSVFPAEDTQIQFCLATVDPDGNPTDGITRYEFNGDFDNNEFDIKQATRWDRSSYMNLWSAPGISALGYAYLPSLSSLPNAILDGVVINADAFGGPGYATFAPYNLGRTATHEVGHYLGLRHVWQSNGCGADDGMSDTPLQDDENFGCPSHPSPSCSNSGDMFMNYMDYVNDNCMNAYTPDQGAYMRSILNGVRSSLLAASNTACTQIDPLVVLVNGEDILCNGANDGQIFVEVSGGVAPYNILLSNGMNSPNGEFSGLPAGTYTVTVTDQSNQIIEEDITINEPQELVLTLVSVSDNLCFPDFGGEIEVTAEGGTNTAGYQYILNGMTQNTTGIFTDLPNGAYNIVVRDDHACEAITETEINSPPSLSLVFAPTSGVRCFGELNASFTATGSGGTGTYEYSINNMMFSVQNSFGNLGAGNYNVVVRDGNGCLLSDTYIISQPSVLTSSVFTEGTLLCFGDQTSSINISAGGGSPPYQFSIDGNNFQSQNDFANLGRGVYQGLVRDLNGCTDFFDAEIFGPEKIEILALDLVNPNCGITNGSIFMTATGGTGPTYEYTINGNSNNNGEFTGLGKGSYDILITDENDCSLTTNVVLDETSNLQVSDAIIMNVHCFGDSTGNISVNAFEGQEPYTYRLGNDENGTGVFENLPAGEYEITVRDAAGCEQILIAEITEPDSLLVLNVISVSNGTGQNDGTISVMAEGGTGPYRYSKDGINYSESSDFRDLGPGIIKIWVIDSLGCLSSVETQISSNDDTEFSLFSVYPNPGQSTFYIVTDHLIENIGIRVFAAEGTLLKEFKSTTGNPSICTLDMSAYTSGVYYIELKNPKNNHFKRIRIIKL